MQKQRPKTPPKAAHQAGTSGLRSCFVAAADTMAMPTSIIKTTYDTKDAGNQAGTASCPPFHTRKETTAHAYSANENNVASASLRPGVLPAERNRATASITWAKPITVDASR